LRDFAASRRRRLAVLAFSLLACGRRPDAQRHEEIAAAAPSPGPRARAPTQTLDHDGIRKQVIGFVRDVAESRPSESSTSTPTRACPLPALAPPLHVVVSMWADGRPLALARSRHDDVCSALEQATRSAVASSRLSRAQLGHVRFAVEFTHLDVAMIEHGEGGVELVKGFVPVRRVDAAMVRRHIDAGRDYLLRVIDPQRGGVHKYYYADTSAFEDRLHTIYTASTVYTLLALYRHDHDERLRGPIEQGGRFLLAMQRIAPGLDGHGAFHYSVDLQGRREPLFVVGTTAKSIFTLIELHAFSKDVAYLDAARLAADWLIDMQEPDGSVNAKLEVEDAGEGELQPSARESTLYAGQLLSALSRLHVATGDERYLAAAARTATYLLDKQAREGCYVGDEYRKANPVSSSWLILSLFDYAAASGDARVRAIAYGCADELLARQLDAPDDIDRHGRWGGSLSSSGNGWLAEVYAVLYRECSASDSARCSEYREAIVRLFRVLMQHTYTPESAFAAKRPAIANGGLFWNTRERYVRTDSVCHALNAYVFMIDELPEGTLLELPEPRFPLLPPA
jgi:hypothetical protein